MHPETKYFFTTQSHLVKNEWSILRPLHLPLCAHRGHHEREEPDAETPHPSFPKHCYTHLCVFFLLLKTDEVQLILVSAVILMPGACVFPTTTGGSRVTAAAAAAAAAGDVGRGR